MAILLKQILQSIQKGFNSRLSPSLHAAAEPWYKSKFQLVTKINNDDNIHKKQSTDTQSKTSKKSSIGLKTQVQNIAL